MTQSSPLPNECNDEQERSSIFLLTAIGADDLSGTDFKFSGSASPTTLTSIPESISLSISFEWQGIEQVEFKSARKTKEGVSTFPKIKNSFKNLPSKWLEMAKRISSHSTSRKISNNLESLESALRAYRLKISMVAPLMVEKFSILCKEKNIIKHCFGLFKGLT